jgi:DNA-binding NarL/FixJ family response regulator
VAPIKLILADHNEIFREGLAGLLKDKKEVKVVSLCSNGRQVIGKVKETQPDVVLIDIDIPDRDSINITNEIRKSVPGVKVAMFTHSEDQDHLYAAIEAGAAGYLSKDMKVGDLVKSIDLIEKGQVVVSSPLAAKLPGKLTAMKTDPDTGKAVLSDREVEVLKLLAIGDTNKEIAEKLFITENTARVHVKNIFEKLQLRNRQQAAAYAVRQGVIKEFSGR